MSLTDNTVAVVDYGMGNLRSVSQAVRTAAADSGWQVVVTSDPEVVLAADRVVLPGQGAMPDCMAAFDRSGLRDAVLEASRSKPMLGVCVGEQMLLERSTEARPGQQHTEGLGLIKGDVVRHHCAGAVFEWLQAALVGPAKRAVELLLPVTGSAGARVSMDKANQLRIILRRLAADHEADDL